MAPKDASCSRRSESRNNSGAEDKDKERDMARLDLGSPDLAAMGGQATNADILLQMGLDCASGRNGATDLVSAHKWFNIASLKGSPDAARYRREIAAEMSGGEIADAQRAAREWLSLH
jgi:TPR repeat protein